MIKSNIYLAKAQKNIKLIFMNTNMRAVNIDTCTMIFLPMLVGWNLPQFNKKVPTRISRKVTLVG